MNVFYIRQSSERAKEFSVAVALSGLSEISGYFLTGRCPVLLFVAPLGLLLGFNK